MDGMARCQEELKVLKRLDYTKEGDCCGQSQCLACSLHGIRIYYIAELNITNSHIDISFFGRNEEITLDELLQHADKEEDDNSS